MVCRSAVGSSGSTGDGVERERARAAALAEYRIAGIGRGIAGAGAVRAEPGAAGGEFTVVGFGSDADRADRGRALGAGEAGFRAARGSLVDDRADDRAGQSGIARPDFASRRGALPVAVRCWRAGPESVAARSSSVVAATERSRNPLWRHRADRRPALSANRRYRSSLSRWPVSAADQRGGEFFGEAVKRFFEVMLPI